MERKCLSCSEGSCHSPMLYSGRREGQLLVWDSVYMLSPLWLELAHCHDLSSAFFALIKGHMKKIRRKAREDNISKRIYVVIFYGNGFPERERRVEKRFSIKYV
jgi:hypothetical protein